MSESLADDPVARDIVAAAARRLGDFRCLPSPVQRKYAVFAEPSNEAYKWPGSTESSGTLTSKRPVEAVPVGFGNPSVASIAHKVNRGERNDIVVIGIKGDLEDTNHQKAAGRSLISAVTRLTYCRDLYRYILDSHGGGTACDRFRVREIPCGLGL